MRHVEDLPSPSSKMGLQCRPVAANTKGTQLSCLVLTRIPKPTEDRPTSKRSAKAPKAETSSIDSRQSKRPGRAPVRTAVEPLAQRVPWPREFKLKTSQTSGRKGKSISPSTSEEAIYTPPGAPVDIESRRSQTSESTCFSSCSTLVDQQGTTISPPLVEEEALESDNGPRPQNSGFHPKKTLALHDQEIRAGKKKKSEVQVLVRKHLGTLRVHVHVRFSTFLIQWRFSDGGPHSLIPGNSRI